MWRQNDKDHAKWEETQCLTFFLVCSQERIKGNNVKKREPAYEAVHSAKDCEGDDSPFYRQQSLNSSHSHLHLGGVQYSCSHKRADDWTAMTLPSLIFNQIFCRCRRLSHRHRHRGRCFVQLVDISTTCLHFISHLMKSWCHLKQWRWWRPLYFTEWNERDEGNSKREE